MKIQATELAIGDVFSDRHRFTIPLYQRPYAWTTEEAGEMFDDLLRASQSEAGLKDTDPYFLGSVVLVKDESRADAEVIDGQQRLTTLTILLAAIRAFLPDTFAGSVEQRIFQQGDPIAGIVDQPRLKLRDQDQWFFEQHIQHREAFATIDSVVTDGLPESRWNLIENARLFRDRLADLTTDDCTKLVQFVVQRTYLVLVATQDFESAYRIFSVLNERGLDLTTSDIIKAEVIGQIPAEDRDAYTKRWEGEEEDLGREEFDELFSHIRMVYAKAKAREAVLKEFRSTVLRRFPDPKQFIDQVLVPLSDAYEIATKATYAGASHADDINRLLRWLNSLDNFDWIPPAISYLRGPHGTGVDLFTFLADLDRLAASMLIRRVDVSRRIERYGQLLTEIEAGGDLPALQLTDDERVATRDRLAGDIYTTTRIRLYILQRLDAALSAGGASYEYATITVEHVLPQNPKTGSEWRTWFTDEERAHWVHRLANLVLLPRRKNSEASNFDFAKKKARYFTTSSGVSPFAITTQVLTHAQWTPHLLQQRQKALLGTLVDLWRL